MPSTDRAQPLADELLHAYEREAKLYADMLALSAAQAEHIRAGADVRRVEACLRRKQHLIDAVAEIEAKLEPLKAEWLALPQADRAAGDRSLDARLRDMAETLARIADTEKESEAELARRKDRTGEALAKLAAGSKVVQAYRPRTDPPAPRFMDRTR